MRLVSAKFVVRLLTVEQKENGLETFSASWRGRGLYEANRYGSKRTISKLSSSFRNGSLNHPQHRKEHDRASGTWRHVLVIFFAVEVWYLLSSLIVVNESTIVSGRFTTSAAVSVRGTSGNLAGTQLAPWPQRFRAHCPRRPGISCEKQNYSCSRGTPQSWCLSRRLVLVSRTASSVEGRPVELV